MANNLFQDLELLVGNIAACRLIKLLRQLGFDSIDQLRPLITIRADLGINSHQYKSAAYFRKLLAALAKEEAQADGDDCGISITERGRAADQ